ncbi:MAG: 50S ribosomal protein L29 [Candidatus Acidiferrales bacterium]
MPRRMEKYRDVSAAELRVQERELTEQVFRLRFQLNTGQAEGLTKLRLAKKDLARIKTLLRASELRKSDGK